VLFGSAAFGSAGLGSAVWWEALEGALPRASWQGTGG
jgi:hypothetical protein